MTKLCSNTGMQTSCRPCVGMLLLFSFFFEVTNMIYYSYITYYICYNYNIPYNYLLSLEDSRSQ